MSFINNIQSVATYESKILIRSWFFKVFTVLAVLILGLLDFAFLIAEDGGGMWIVKAIPSNLPYFNLLLLNTGQAVICIFLASEFLKRDKKLDTSEVFYVRPLSNAEYVIGKIWGNLRVFLILNLIIMGIALLFNCIASGMGIDWLSYPVYFLLISIPTQVFIIGLSIFLMLVLKNQALTFIILLGYIGLTIFYIGDKFYYLFDYMAYSLPLTKSTIVGFTNLEAILNHRAIYFFAGLAFVFFTIFLFRRLPNSSRSNYPWFALSFGMLLASGAAGYKHVHTILQEGDSRALYTAINNKYVQTPKMTIDRYDISLEQQPETFFSEVTMKGTALEAASVFTFCLNPGLQVQEITRDGKSLRFERDHQILLVDFGEQIIPSDTVTFSIKYGGKIDSRFCYLDIPAEVLQREYTNFLFNIDKQYVFQTKDFLLFTPETYWYPRPGTAYSDVSSDWQQTYFSKFRLQVTPLSGLVPLSQGEGVKADDGSYSFEAEYPVQAVSLIVGKYKQQSAMSADSTLYSIWHIEGNDYYTATFDSIRDTIPSLVNDIKENLERTYKLSYPFSRFSVVEVPVQFSSYPRAWSQAQETVQPEMVLFPEKGCTFGQLDVDKAWKSQVRWTKRGGRDITETEAKIQVFNNFLWTFTRQEGNYNFSSSGRGNFNISSEANPYFLFPQLYNFRYNIFSPEWPVANTAIELYLQKKSDNSGWERDINGISNNEKASLLMEKQTFKELLADVEHRDLLTNIISLKTYRLFALPEINIGVDAFRDSLYTLLERNTFRNIQFESLLDTLGQVSHADIRSGFAEWKRPTPLPYYSVEKMEVTKVTDRGEESFVLKIQISNNSDYEGIVHLEVQGVQRGGQQPDPRANRKIILEPHQTKLLVSVWENAPRYITINTMISGNLPSVISQQIGNIKEERKRQPDEEGDFVISGSSHDNDGEIIVDNEDSALFVLSEPDVVGLLPKWLDKVGDTSFKYSGVSDWRPPLQWTATTNNNYYGKYIRSAYVIKSGNGSQTATWKIPIPAEGQYDAYYYVSKSNEMRYNDRMEAEYRFKVRQGEETEDAYINLRKANEGWEQLGVYYFTADTAYITLTNECKLRSVAADAVRLVKR
ncbi:golvesin C-terminal-like domain-containing protein [Parabacteroides sp.]